MGLTDDEWGDLQVTMAKRSPVLVLGPGCHRVGYDQSRPWDEVVRRVSLVWAELGMMSLQSDTPDQCKLFLKHLWLEETQRRDHRGLSPVLGRSPLRRPGHQRLAYRRVLGRRSRCSALAASLLMVLYETTRCLGNVVATGALPVAHWSAVRPGRFGSGTGAATAGDEPGHLGGDAQDANMIRELAQSHMAAVVKISTSLDRMRAGQMLPDDEAIREEHGLRFGSSEQLTKTLTLLKIEAVRKATEHLAANYFDEHGAFKITGALVEWLADLFWHLMVTDSRVPLHRPSSRST